MEAQKSEVGNRPPEPRTSHLPPPASLTVSAPGSLMIAGEHAVLQGHHALVGAVDQRVFVTIAPRPDRTIAIHSALGERQMPCDTIDDSRPFQFLGAILKRQQPHFKNGFELTITADFPADIGLGSSSAVTVAALAALQTWTTGFFPDREALMKDAVAIIREVQGMGSGSDIAAAVWGGILLYKPTPEVVARYEHLPPMTLIYAGYKTPTPEVVNIVEERRQNSVDQYTSLYSRINAATLSAAESLDAGDWPALGSALNTGQLLMQELGVSDEALTQIANSLQGMNTIYGAKISGSGLGDCVLGIGTLDSVDWPYRTIPATFSSQGVMLEENPI
jgi:mevalonate kinase